MSIISNVVKRREKTDETPTRWVSWSDKGPDFEILPMTDDLLEEIQEAAVDPEQKTRTERVRGFRVKKVPNVKDELVGQATLEKLIKGWRRFTVGMLGELMDPTKAAITLDGVKADTAVPYAEDMKAELAEFSGLWFREFLSEASVSYADFQQEHVEEEVEDLEPTPVGT